MDPRHRKSEGDVDAIIDVERGSRLSRHLRQPSGDLEDPTPAGSRTPDMEGESWKSRSVRGSGAILPANGSHDADRSILEPARPQNLVVGYQVETGERMMSKHCRIRVAHRSRRYP